MFDVLVGMKADIEMLKTAFGNALKVGPVEIVDAKKGYRLKLGDGPSGPFLSPWYPHPESGGGTSTWFPMTKGQIVGVINPSGDPRQGVMFRAGFSGINPQPSEDLDANLFSAFGVTVSVKGGKLTLEGDLLVRGNTDFDGGHVRHNGTSIDDTHVHGGVIPGGSNTAPPA